MSQSGYYKSPFVTTRISRTGAAFVDLFTGKQLLLREPAASALASVFRSERSVAQFMEQFPAEATRAADASFFISEEPPLPYLRAMMSCLDIEPAGSCNAVCTMCPRASMTRPKSVMTPATFDAVCQQLSSTFPQAIRQIFFCGFGEPTQNPRLAEMSRQIRAVAPAATITVISNGSLLSDDTVDALVHSEVNVFSCSFQSNTKRRYEAIMRGLSFDTTVDGLRRLINASRNSRLKVVVNITSTPDNGEEIPEMTTAWQRAGAQVVVNHLHNRGGFLTLEREGHFAQNQVAARCGLFNSRLFISSEGDLLSCCHDITGETRMGNLVSESLTDLLRSRFERIVRSDLFPICARCDDDSALVTVRLPSEAASDNQRITA